MSVQGIPTRTVNHFTKGKIYNFVYDEEKDSHYTLDDRGLVVYEKYPFAKRTTNLYADGTPWSKAGRFELFEG